MPASWCWLHHIHPGADDGCHVAMVLGDNMDIFVLLVYWTWRCDLQGDLSIQMKMWDGIVLYVNATCAECGGTICSQLLLSPRMQPTHCDTVSYTVGKDNTTTLKTLKDWAIRGYSKKIWFAAFHTNILN